MKRRQDSALVARYRSKARKRAQKEYYREIDYKNRTTDPLSSDEGAGVA